MLTNTIDIVRDENHRTTVQRQPFQVCDAKLVIFQGRNRQTWCHPVAGVVGGWSRNVEDGLTCHSYCRIAPRPAHSAHSAHFNFRVCKDPEHPGAKTSSYDVKDSKVSKIVLSRYKYNTFCFERQHAFAIHYNPPSALKGGMLAKWNWDYCLLLFADTLHAHAQKHSQHVSTADSCPGSVSDPVQGRNTAKAVAAASAVNPALPLCWWTTVSLCLTTFHIVSCYAWIHLNTLLDFACLYHPFSFCIEFVCFKGPCPWWPLA